MKDKFIIISILILIAIDLIYVATSKVRNGSNQSSVISNPSAMTESSSPAAAVQSENQSPNVLSPAGRPTIDSSKIHYEDDEGYRGSRD